MKKRIEKYFSPAIVAIENVLVQKYGDKEIPREYQGYISAFGASVLQMGLLPTLAVHADNDSGSKEDRGAILKILTQTIMANDGAFLTEKAHSMLKASNNDLFRAAVNLDTATQRELTERILDATVAVKLCLRTFKLSKS